MQREIEFVLNGHVVRAGGFSTQFTLLDYLRDRGLTGAKEGCAEGECGACAVLVLAAGENGTEYRALNSCLISLPAVADREIVTVEGLANNGQLTEVQRAMVEHGGSQCGYCTPGFVISMFAEHAKAEQTPRDPHVLGANLCRCTGYRPIADAFQSLGALSNSPWVERLHRNAPAPRRLDYRDGEQRFSRPTSLADVLAIFAADSHLVAGNTDLGVLANLRNRTFGHLISVEAVPEMRQFRESAAGVEIGAALTLSEIAEKWMEPPAAFREWVPLFASPLIRNRATLGGNLGTASPIGDAAPLLLALDAELEVVSLRGTRSIPLERFFTGYRQNALEPGELIRVVRIPKPFPDHTAFFKVAKRRMDDISTVAAAFSFHINGNGLIANARIAFGGAASTPVRAYAAEALLEGVALKQANVKDVKQAIASAVTPINDHRGSAAYRRAMAQNLFEKFIETRELTGQAR